MKKLGIEGSTAVLGNIIESRLEKEPINVGDFCRVLRMQVGKYPSTILTEGEGGIIMGKTNSNCYILTPDMDMPTIVKYVDRDNLEIVKRRVENQFEGMSKADL